MESKTDHLKTGSEEDLERNQSLPKRLVYRTQTKTSSLVYDKSDNLGKISKDCVKELKSASTSFHASNQDGNPVHQPIVKLNVSKKGTKAKSDTNNGKSNLTFGKGGESPKESFDPNLDININTNEKQEMGQVSFKQGKINHHSKGNHFAKSSLTSSTADAKKKQSLKDKVTSDSELLVSELNFKKTIKIPSLLEPEIKYLEKRFRGAGPFTVDINNNSSTVNLTMPITDPDFPFDIPSLPLTLELSENANQIMIRVSVSESYTVIPAAVKRRIDRKMEEASKALIHSSQANSPTALNDPVQNQINRRIFQRPKIIVVKSLLTFLERNLEKWMVALPVVVPSSSVKIVPLGHVSAPSLTDPKGDSVIDLLTRDISIMSVGVPIRKNKRDLSQNKGPSNENHTVPLGRFRLPLFIKYHTNPTLTSSPPPHAIILKLEGLKLMGIGLCIPVQLSILFQCHRCRAPTVVDDLRPLSDRIIACSKCKQYSNVTWNPSSGMFPGKDGNSLGFLICKRTTPADLLPETQLQMTCSECLISSQTLKSSSGQNSSLLDSSLKIDPLGNCVLVCGAAIPKEECVFACRNCHHRQSFSYDRVEWDTVQPPTSGSSAAIKASSKKTALLLPTKIGEPLPEGGTCIHFSKSRRWFRFPCCGRAYPCEKCHDLESQRTGNPHHAEWAERQICGYCSREFSSSVKLCACGEAPGAAPKSTGFWEGGKGTRDKTLLSRKDSRKYRDLQKTIPNSSKK